MVQFRPARSSDLTEILRLLADDPLGKTRETVSDGVDTAYEEAFAAMEADPNQLMAVGVDDSGDVVACLQITFIPGLSRGGMWRGQIESVRVSSRHRGQGLGRALLDWAIARCRERGCGLVQLTSDKTRADAIRFYEGLGFTASHEGLKLAL
ncbi:GNAT family N-acetyltransferase [Kaustia mangrovi]|uniref:GNAT family N-acetyltransferase n=1 Tax=Kaustia mangrovi TaxID=2593653 RepID=A0A7S8HC47_9HYPH|nr:GNAT family N-acetyltransferase [Kaustia mangrovi]QPC43094.1 GNAT family N-acetyltransferase [Kaustia mangrovi]